MQPSAKLSEEGLYNTMLHHDEKLTDSKERNVTARNYYGTDRHCTGHVRHRNTNKVFPQEKAKEEECQRSHEEKRTFCQQSFTVLNSIVGFLN